MKRVLGMAALGLFSLTACSDSTPHSAGSVSARSSAASTGSSPSASASSSMGSSSSSTSASPAPTTHASSSASAPLTTSTTAPSGAASPRSQASYTCHYEEGDAPCDAAEYASNKRAWAQYQAKNNQGSAPSTPTPSVKRDANGFALGGPAYPKVAEHPTPAQCRTFRSALTAWANYQNARRPAGSTNQLPSSGDVQFLGTVCGLSYYG